MIYDFICDDLYVPMKAKEIAAVLQVPKEQREDLRAVLDALEAEGKIFVSAKGKYTKGQAKRLTGTFQAHARGFGFVIREGETEDVFIPEEQTCGAFQGDEVEFIITRQKRERIVRRRRKKNGGKDRKDPLSHNDPDRRAL